MADEMIAIKVLYLRPARAPGQSRNMSQVWFRHHRRHRGGNVFVDKFCPDMGVENFAEVLHRGIFRHGNASPWSNCDKRPTDGRTHNRFDELATSHRAPKGLDKASYRLELGNSERQLFRFRSKARRGSNVRFAPKSGHVRCN